MKRSHSSAISIVIVPALILGLTQTLPAHAQNGNGGSSQFSQGSPNLNRKDKAFLLDVARGSLYEYQSAQIAVSQATRPDVRQYAQKLLADHEQANQELSVLMRLKNLPMPRVATDSDIIKLGRLRRVRGTAFDAAYIKEAIQINNADAIKSKREGTTGKDPDVQQFALKLSTADQDHAAIAQSLKRSNGSRGNGRRGGTSR